MTADQFRKNPDLVSAWRELLAKNPVVAQVMVVLKDERPTTIVPHGSDALDRAAALGRLEQHETDYNLLLSLTEPPLPEPTEQEETWGIDPKQFPKA